VRLGYDHDDRATTATTAAAGGATTTTAAAETTLGRSRAAGGTLSVDIGDPSFIDPAVAFESEGIQVDQAVFDRLCKFNFKTNDIEPSVRNPGRRAPMVLLGPSISTGHQVPQRPRSGRRRLQIRLGTPDRPNQQVQLPDPSGHGQGYDEMTNSAAKELSGVVATDSYTLTVTLTSPSRFPMISPWPRPLLSRKKK